MAEREEPWQTLENVGQLWRWLLQEQQERLWRRARWEAGEDDWPDATLADLAPYTDEARAWLLADGEIHEPPAR